MWTLDSRAFGKTSSQAMTSDRARRGALAGAITVLYIFVSTYDALFLALKMQTLGPNASAASVLVVLHQV